MKSLEDRLEEQDLFKEQMSLDQAQQRVADAVKAYLTDHLYLPQLDLITILQQRKTSIRLVETGFRDYPSHLGRYTNNMYLKKIPHATLLELIEGVVKKEKGARNTFKIRVGNRTIKNSSVVFYSDSFIEFLRKQYKIETKVTHYGVELPDYQQN